MATGFCSIALLCENGRVHSGRKKDHTALKDENRNLPQKWDVSPFCLRHRMAESCAGMSAAGLLNGSLHGYNGIAESLFDGNTTPRIFSVLSSWPPSVSCLNNFEIGSNNAVRFSCSYPLTGWFTLLPRYSLRSSFCSTSCSLPEGAVGV